jgi:class 3 adenylate cyclase/predicted ATPase
MDFYEVLDQVVDLLRQRGRASYRALKVQFRLDDEALEALKDELIEVHQLARDQDGRMLVWAGETSTVPEPTTLHPAQLERPQQDQLTPVETRADPHPREAERRQLTVMFCDLVDSTRLSSQLDPEDYREVVREYQWVCTEVIQRYDGHIAQYLGDGLLVYFGYPVAHEEDAQRAVHSGLGIVAAIQSLNIRLEQEKSIRLAVRLGIHTGLVVVGEIGGEGHQEQLALGETPNVAARIQGFAEPDTVVISGATYRLIQGYFDCRNVGEQTLRGVSQPVPIYQVLQESGVQSRLDVASTRGLTPLIGREQEVGLLLERWEQVKVGQGQVILLSGEAGIGKSRLVQVLRAHVANEPHVRWECRSSPYYQNTALYPMTDLLQRILQWQQDDTPEERLGKLEQALSQFRRPMAETVPLFATLLSVPMPDGRYQPLNLSPQRQRQKTLEAILTIMLELAERQPVLLILEDLHWTDPTTLALLALLLEHTPTTALYLLATCRPEFQPPWSHRSYLTEITINRLTHHQIEQMATQVAGGKMLPADVLEQLVEKSDGVPLHVEEMTKSILESGVLKETNEYYELSGSLSSLTIPATLQDSLMARLDRLMTAKVIAQLGAVMGRQFSYELLQAVAQLDEPTLQRELGRLVEAELLHQRGLPPHAIYTFKHALIQDAAYQSLLRSTRHQYHQRIVRVLEEQFSQTLETQPELLAHHCTEAGLNEQAIGYWQRAGEKAIQRSAHVEAIVHFNKGLTLLPVLPDTTERTQQELDIQIALGSALAVTKGQASPEVESTYTRARELCQQIENSPLLFSVLSGLRRCYVVRGALHTVRELDEYILPLAQRQQDLGVLVEAHRELGHTLFLLGEFPRARTHLEQGMALYDAQRHRPQGAFQDEGVACLAYTAWVLWLLGYPDQALGRNAEGITLAQQVSHLYSLAYARTYAALLYQCRREWQETQKHAEAVVALSREQGFAFWFANGTILRGWALAMQGHVEEGMTQIQRGLETRQATGALGRSWFAAHLAEAYGKSRQIEEGLLVLTGGLALVDKTGECAYEAELHRLKGELLLQQSSDNQPEAESCFQQAIAVAQSQSAKSWELRAATSLAKLWQSQDKRHEAYDLLAPVYGWFTEGFDTADLKDAKALLDELGA